MPDVRCVLILAPNWLGDAVMALPAVADVRRHFGAARLVVAARRSVAALFTMVPGVDDVIQLDARGQGLEVAAIVGDAARMRRLRADVAILLPNSFAAAAVAWLSRVPERWGYRRDGRGALLTRAIPAPGGSQHQALYYQALLAALGIPGGPPVARIDVPDRAVQEARRQLEEAGWKGRPLLVLAPGAAYGTAKRWWPEHFSSLVTAVTDAGDLHCVFVGAPSDRPSVDAVVGGVPSAARKQVIDLCGETTLEVLGGLLRLATVCVSNDSGAMHLAAASGVPLAAIFGPTNEQETAPLTWPGVASELVIHPVPCRPCMLRDCPIDHPCMRDLTPDRVLAVVRRLMAPAPSLPLHERSIVPIVTEVP